MDNLIRGKYDFHENVMWKIGFLGPVVFHRALRGGYNVTITSSAVPNIFIFLKAEV